MAFFYRNKHKIALMDEIRCDESSYLIWKWHPSGVRQGETTRENAIRWGSPLRVKDGEVAAFVYEQENGCMQDFIVGPYDQIIETENLPVLSNIIGLAYKNGTPFPAEIYFINLAGIIQVRFGVPFFDVYDSQFTNLSVPVAVRGTVSFGIADYREFIRLYRLQTFNLEDLQKQIRDMVNRHVKNVVMNAPEDYNISALHIESKISQINNEVENNLIKRLKETFGIAVSSIDIGAIEIDKTSEGYRQLIK